MSKADLKLFLKRLKKQQIEAQVIDLYDRFKEVKAFYDFSFRPNEDKLRREAMMKIRKEYFPETRRKAKTRRSVAQKLIRQYLALEVDRALILEIMLFHVKMGLDYQNQFIARPESYFKAFALAFDQAITLAEQSGLGSVFEEQFIELFDRVLMQKWPNVESFEHSLARVIRPNQV